MNTTINILKDKTFIRFVIKFILIFSFCYFGTLAIIGLAAPGGYYSVVIDTYFDYVSGIKNALIAGTRGILGLFNIHTYTVPGFIVRIVNGTGVMIAYDCVGYGVMSFWAAYVISSSGKGSSKIIWTLTGFLILFIINVIRISLLLVAFNKHWAMPMGLNHHTWFNIVAYIAIFIMIYFFDRRLKVTTISHVRPVITPGT